MNTPYPNFDRAQRNYDRREPDDPIREEFTHRHVEDFMRDFAQCGADPADWLNQEGIRETWFDGGEDVAAFLQSTALTCVAGHLTAAGSDLFWQVMKRMAIDRFDYQQENN